MANEYDIGDKRRLKGIVRDAAGDPTDASITFRMRSPSGLVVYVHGVDPELVRETTGIYYVDWTMTEAGQHDWGMDATGAVVESEETTFYVRPRRAV